MRTKRILMFCIMMLMVSGAIAGCSGNKVSDEAKRLYNEQAEIYRKKAAFLERCFSQEKPTTGMPLLYPTSFFHLTEEEREVYENADFGDEMTENLKKGEAIEQDADQLSDAFPASSFNVTESEIDNLNKVFQELKQKYQGFDYSIKMYE